MALKETLIARSQNKCEACQSVAALSVYEVAGAPYSDAEGTLYLCEKCQAQIEKKQELDAKHWECLKESMWSEVPAMQVTAWRMLSRLRIESWAADSLDMLYLDDEKMAWAKSTGDHENDASVDLHKDAFGAVLQNGDNVVLTKSLDVKGSTVNAKVGTVVRNIRLVHDNTEQIEGRIEGQLIVILTKYLRKQG